MRMARLKRVAAQLQMCVDSFFRPSRLVDIQCWLRAHVFYSWLRVVDYRGPSRVRDASQVREAAQSCVSDVSVGLETVV